MSLFIEIQIMFLCKEPKNRLNCVFKIIAYYLSKLVCR